MIGNAVPLALAAYVGRSIVACERGMTMPAAAVA
jgi:hypothetical protein